MDVTSYVSSAMDVIFDADYMHRWYIITFLLTGYTLYYIREVAKVRNLLHNNICRPIFFLAQTVTRNVPPFFMDFDPGMGAEYRVPLVVCGKGRYRDFLEKNLPILKEKFWPTVWCIESRAQTILASLLRGGVQWDMDYRREILNLPDGGEVALDWKEDCNCPEDAPLVLILPGLTGCSQEEYIKVLVRGAIRCGYRTVVFNNRGLGGCTLKTSRFYNACNIDDISEVMNHIQTKYPNVLIAATGISMGGLVLGNYIAKLGKEGASKLAAALLISVPWNIFKASESIEQPGINMMLNRHLANSLCRALEKQRREEYDVSEMGKNTTIREFDSKFTCKMFGYPNVDAYYSDATLHDKLDRFHVPTLCLSAADDPFQPLEAIPLDEFGKHKNVAIVVTARGGHIGFMEGFLPRIENSYMTRIMTQFFQAVFTDGIHSQSELDSYD